MLERADLGHSVSLFSICWIVMLLFELTGLTIPPKGCAATCGTSGTEYPAFDSPETKWSSATARWWRWCSSHWHCCTCLLRPRAHHKSHASVHWDARDWKLIRLWISAGWVVHTILIKSSDRIVFVCKSSLKSEIDGMSANWHIRLYSSVQSPCPTCRIAGSYTMNLIC